ncbi:MAG: tail fiber protein [Pseudomonadota bacterium]
MPATPFVGQIMPAGFGIIPKGWAPCNGQLLAITANQALFSLIGTTYGGDGVRTFALPDLRGRAVLGCNFNSVPWGLVSGTENVTLTPQQLPTHNHTLMGSTTAGSGRSQPPTNQLFGVNTLGSPATKIFATAGAQEVPLSVSTNITNTGGNLSHNNMQPFLVINYLIALQGIFPSRP